MQPPQQPNTQDFVGREAQEGRGPLERHDPDSGRDEPLSRRQPPSQARSWLPDIYVAALLIAVFLVDQVTKAWVRSHMLLEESIPAQGFFRLTYTTNTGSAFGLFPNQTTALTLASFVGIGILILFFRNQSVPVLWLRTSLGLQLGGAAGNLVDRLTLGRVTDFIDVGPWPVFNMADASIVTGLLVLAWFLLTTKEASKAPAQVSKESNVSQIEEPSFLHDDMQPLKPESTQQASSPDTEEQR